MVESMYNKKIDHSPHDLFVEMDELEGEEWVEQARWIKYEEAREAFETSLEQDPDFDSGHLGLAQYHLAIGEYESAQRELDLSLNQGTAISYYYSAAIHAAAGDNDVALKKLGASLRQGFRDFAVLEASPYFESLRSDPRYEELIGRYKDD